MKLIADINNKLRLALINKNQIHKDILRFILGQAQTLSARNGSVTESTLIKVIQKAIDNNKDNINLLKDLPNRTLDIDKATEENKVLHSLLPTQLSFSETEAFFLNSDNPEFELIQKAKSEGQAIGIAMKAFKSTSLSVNNDTVIQVVKKIRELT